MCPDKNEKGHSITFILCSLHLTRALHLMLVQALLQEFTSVPRSIPFFLQHCPV